jgi:hypothetical protein
MTRGMAASVLFERPLIEIGQVRSVRSAPNAAQLEAEKCFDTLRLIGGDGGIRTLDRA